MKNKSSACNLQVIKHLPAIKKKIIRASVRDDGTGFLQDLSLMHLP